MLKLHIPMQSRFFVLICDQTAFSLPICLVRVFNNLSVLHLHFSLVIFGDCFVD